MNLSQHTHANVNDLVVNMTLGNKSDFVGMILENGSDSCISGILENGLSVKVSQIDWIPFHNGPPHYHPSFLDYLGPFSGAYLLPPISNLSPIYATAPPPSLFPRTVYALWHLISFGVFDMTPLRGQIVPPLARAPYLRVFFAFVPTMWTPKKTQQICFWHGLPNVLQTFSLCMSHC